MPTSQFTSTIAVPPDTLYRWHAQEGAFERLIPPGERVELIDRTGGLEVGARAKLRMRVGPLALPWDAVHTEHVAGRSFTDVAERGPFARWRHEHRFEPEGEGLSRLEDRIEWRLPLGPLGALGNRWARRRIERMFSFRHRRTSMDLERHHAAALSPCRIAVSGASGLIGRALVAFLKSGGHDVVPLVRGGSGPGIAWDPMAGEVDGQALEGIDVVVHLAGENIAGGRWTDARKARIRDSRVMGTATLARAVAGLARPPRVFVSASAVGYYGHVAQGDVTEDSPRGEGFLAEVCDGWERAADPARDAGIRVVHPRFGVVLSAGGGALERMLLPFQAGLGGPIGSGEQWMSAVGLDDAVGAVLHMIADTSLVGPVNITLPEPMSNRAFAQSLGEVLRRPAVLPLPALAVRALFGEMGQALLLEGAPVRPARLQRSGFRFRTPTLRETLRHELNIP